jgi:hypothetical protein
MEEKFGLIKGIECKTVKTDQALIDALSKKTGIDSDKMYWMLRYNMFTVNQFSQLSGLTVSVIHNKIRPVLEGETYITELDFCYPHQDKENEGPKFIVRNAKSEKLLHP